MTVAAIVYGIIYGAAPVAPTVPLTVTLAQLPISAVIKSLAIIYGPFIAAGLILKNEDEDDPEIVRKINRQFSGIRALISSLIKQTPHLAHEKKNIDKIVNTVADETLRLSQQNERNKIKLEELVEAAKAIDINQIKNALDSLFKNLKDIEENIDLYLPILDDIKVSHKDVKEAEELLKAAPEIIKILTKEIEEIATLIKELGEEEGDLIDQYVTKAKVFTEKLNSQLKEANVG